MITMNIIQDTINADPLKLVSALSKVESDLMQNITNLKDKVINLKGIMIKNLQDEKIFKCFGK